MQPFWKGIGPRARAPAAAVRRGAARKSERADLDRAVERVGERPRWAPSSPQVPTYGPETVRLDRTSPIGKPDDGHPGETPGGNMEIVRGRGCRGERPGPILLLARFPRADLVPEGERLARVERHVDA